VGVDGDRRVARAPAGGDAEGRVSGSGDGRTRVSLRPL